MRFFLLSLLFFFPGWSDESFILMNASTDEVLMEFGSHLETRATPACSFNIALSLMGYDLGILNDENTPLWDFQEGFDAGNEAWKASHSPQSWMIHSCLWYSKMLGLKLGLEPIQRYLTLFDYGNQDMSGGLANPGPNNSAWLSSSLKISPREQVNFVQKMINRAFPILPHAYEMTKAVLFKEVLSDGWHLYGKTGMGSQHDIKVRWFVGWVEKNDDSFAFSYQLQEKNIDVNQTVPNVKLLLAEAL